jgi:hypothetical protein
MSVGATSQAHPARCHVLALSLWLCAIGAAAQDATEDAANAEAAPVSRAPGPAVAAPAAVQMVVQVGAGVTQRIVSMPTEQGRISLTTSLSPAFDVRASGRIRFERWFVRVRAGYQSSLGLHADDHLRLPVADQHSSAVRSHRFEGGFAPGFWLGESNGAALSLYLGYGLRAFSSVAPLVLPRFTLHGPLLRLEFELPVIAHRLWLQLAPEGQLMTSYSRDLSRVSHVFGPGVAVGGEAGLVLRLVSSLAMRLTYREAHAHIAASSLGSAGFEDIERYFLADVLVTY